MSTANNESGSGIGRVPPHSVEAEEYLLSCCLLDGSDTIARCLEAKLAPIAFYVPANRVIFEKLCELYQKSPPVAIEKLIEELRTTKQLEAVGGVPYLMQVSGRIPTTAQAAYFIARVRKLHLAREVIRIGVGAVEEAFDGHGEIVEQVQRLRGQVTALDADASSLAGAFTVWTVEDLRRFIPPKDTGLLAENTAHPLWSVGGLALLVGAGGVGKTRLALQLAVAQVTGRKWCGLLTLPQPRRWLFVGNENSTVRLQHDLLAMIAKYPAEDVRLVAERLFVQVLGTTEDSLIALDDPAAITRWRATLARIKPDVLVVDPWEAVVIGGDVNDAAATRETMRLLLDLMLHAGIQPTILVVHHARQGAEATRRAVGYDASAFAKGSKTLTAIARLQVNVAAGDDEGGGKLVIACGKCNDAKQFTTRGVVLDEKTQTYAIDEDFDLQAWIDDVEGKRTGKTVTIADVVGAVREGNHKTGDIVATLKESLGASERSVKRRLKDAESKGYLAATMPRGSYTLGNKHREAA